MANITGIAITIKAFLPTGKTIDEQFAALSIVKEAHASGDYSKVLAAAKIDEVKSEQKTRRVDDEPVNTTEPQDDSGLTEMFEAVGTDAPAENEQSDEAVPSFLKGGKSKSSAA